MESYGKIKIDKTECTDALVMFSLFKVLLPDLAKLAKFDGGEGPFSLDNQVNLI